MVREVDNKFEPKHAFLEIQKAMSTELEIPLEFTTHPTAIGDVTAANWAKMLRAFLPNRYEVGPIFALDAKGCRSEQIDLAINGRRCRLQHCEGLISCSCVTPHGSKAHCSFYRLEQCRYQIG